MINQGAIIEAFVGKELLVKREAKGSLAEVDYLIESDRMILPVEVKSNHGSTLKSLHQFLQEHPKSSFGIRFWGREYVSMEKLDSRPLYATATLAHPDDALRALLIHK